MNDDKLEALVRQVYVLIERDELPLPTLPHVAARVRKLIDDPNVSARQVVSVISGDPALTAHIVRSANSAAFAGQPPVEDVHAAIKRMGYRQARNIVMTVTMPQLLQARGAIVQQLLTEYWQHSRHVAAVSYVLASHQQHLNPDQALMAGLIHDIGIVPLCLSIDELMPALDWKSTKSLLRRFHIPVGIRLLRSWNFPDDMVEIVSGHEDLQRQSHYSPLADYTDVVTVANMQDRITARIAAWDKIAAVRRLGMTPDDCRNFLERFDDQLATTYDMLGLDDSVRQHLPDAVTFPSIRPQKERGGTRPLSEIHAPSRKGR